MSPTRFRYSPSILLILLSVFLAAAGISRYIETDSGNILIHDITCESYEGFPYGARLFRPLQASSLNRRPSVLLIPGDTANRYTCDHIAMELARRGFVALTMEDFGQGTTDTAPDYETENLVDAGYTFLATRSFTDPTLIGLAAFYAGTEKAAVSKSFSEFSSRVFISPSADSFAGDLSDTRIFVAKFETDSEFFIPDPEGREITYFSNLHTDMIASAKVIADIMEQFHEDLTIPNDSPLWFDSHTQRAQILVGLRVLLLFLLFMIAVCISSMITSGKGILPWKIAGGILLPILIFILIGDFMNFFLISVRLGSPFQYLPGILQNIRHFSPLLFLIILCITVLCTVPIGNRFYISDIPAFSGLLIFLFIFTITRLNGSSELLPEVSSSIKWPLTVFMLYAFLYSFLIRTTEKNNITRFCTACTAGTVFYLSVCRIFC